MPDRKPSQSEQPGLPAEATPHPDPMELRRRAEEEISALELQQAKALSPEETQRALHELRVHQIELEMQNEELRRVQAELDASRVRYFDLYDLAPVGYCTLSETGDILEANLTAATLLGVARGSLLKTPLTRFVVSEDQDTYYLHRKHLFETGEPQVCELRMAKPDGASFWVRLEAIVARNEETGVSICRVVMSDITESKQAEEDLRESEERFRAIASHTPDHIIIQDRELGYRFVVNPQLGLTEADMIGKTDWDILEEKDAEKLTVIKRRVIETGEPARIETSLQNLKGEVEYFEGAYVPSFDATGKSNGLIGYFRNITERKQAEEALRQSEASLQSVLESTADGILAISSENRVIFSNQRFAELWKIPPAVIASKEDAALLQHVLDQLIDPQGFLQQVQELYNSEEESFDTLHFKDGRIFERLSRPLIFGDKPSGRVWSFRDITERKRAEEALRESEELYRTLVESIGDSIVVRDREGRYLLANTEAARRIGRPPEQIIGKTIRQLHDATISTSIEQEDAIVLSSGHSLDFERRGYSPIAPEYMSIRKVPLRNTAGEVVGLVMVSRDITERKRAEETIKQSEEMLRGIFASAPDSITVTDRDGKITFCNQATVSMRGYSSTEQLIGKTFYELVAEEDRQRAMADMERLPMLGTVRDVPFIALMNNGERFEAELSVSVLRDDQGATTGFVGITKDVTERNRAVEALRESEELYRTLVESLEDGVTVIDTHRRYKLANSEALRRWGIASKMDALDKTISELFPPEVSTQLDAEIAQVIETGKLSSYERHGMAPEGPEWVERRRAPVRNQTGEVIAVVTISRDITGRKRAEEALRESEELYRTLVESIGDGVSVVDIHRRFRLANSEALSRWGYASQEEVLGKTVSELFPLEIAGQIAAEIDTAIRSGTTYGREGIALTPRGPEWVDRRRAPIRNQAGEVTGIVTISRDITERKRAEEQLRQSVEQTRVALQGTIGALSKVFEVRDPYTSGHQIRVSELAVALATRLGLPEDEIQGIKFASLIHDLGKMQVPSEILNKPGKLSSIEMMMIRNHPEAGYDMLKDIAFPWPIGEIVLQHHERMDGSGYPNGLAGDHICLAARIIAVVDVVEAMASHRPYRAALGLEAALAEIEQNSETLYDAKVTAVCLALFRDQGYQFE